MPGNSSNKNKHKSRDLRDLVIIFIVISLILALFSLFDLFEKIKPFSAQPEMNKGYMKVPNTEIKIKRLDGLIVDVEIASTPITYYEIPHIITIIRDITERKRTEEKLRESKERLEKTIDNRRGCTAQRRTAGFIKNYIIIYKYNFF